jgi:hypothetical protein
MKRLLTVAVVAGSMFAVAALASAAEPTQADFDACNLLAQAGGSNPSASPQAGGATGPSITTPAGTPDSTGGVQPGGAQGKTGPMVTGSGREPGSTGGVGGGTGAVAKDSTDGTPAGAAIAQLRGMSEQGAKDLAFKTAYQECMKLRGF